MSATITAIESQQRRSDRVSVFLDGRYAFGLQCTTAAGLCVGEQLSEAEIETLRENDEAEVAYENALYYLSFRPRSEYEIQRYLERKGTKGKALDLVLNRLRRAGLVDDDEFARLWVDHRESLHPRGGRALRAELRQKGIGRDTIEHAIVGIDEEASAMRAAQHVAPRLAKAGEQAFQRRLLGYLQRRGFSAATAYKVTKRLWQGISTGEEPS